MAENLKEYVWKYIVVDIRWFVENDKAGGYNQTNLRYVIDGYVRYMPAVNRFPSAKNWNGFKEPAGLDKECIEHTGEANVKFHVFSVHPSGAEPKDSLKIYLDFQDIGLKGTCSVRSLWAKKYLGQFTNKASLYVKNHRARLFRISSSE
jgi:hypothetical protein